MIYSQLLLYKVTTSVPQTTSDGMRPDIYVEIRHKLVEYVRDSNETCAETVQEHLELPTTFETRAKVKLEMSRDVSRCLLSHYYRDYTFADILLSLHL